MTNIVDSVRLLGESLDLGSSVKSTCPQCSGGSSNEVSFSVTRDRSGLLWNCYRASCSAQGFFPDNGVYSARAKPKTVIKTYKQAVRKLVDTDIAYFDSRFGVSESDRHFYYTDSDEYVFPIKDVVGLKRGYVIRQPVWKGNPESPRQGVLGKPKALTFPDIDAPMQSFYAPPTDCSIVFQDVLVVVEDQLSALKVAQSGVHSVALLGTTVNADKVAEWQKLNPSLVIVALDADATAQSFRIAAKWQAAFLNLRVQILERDLKEESNNDILHILGLY